MDIVKVNNSPNEPVPIEASALPLPTGAATEAKQLPDGHTVTSIPIDDDTSSGTLAASAEQAYLLDSGRSSISWQITGTWTGTLYFEKSIDNTNWVAMYYQTGMDVISETTVNGIYYSALGSAQRVKIRRGAGTGTINFSVARSVGEKAVGLISPLPSGTNNIGKVTDTSAPVKSTVNSTTTPLGGGATFTGTWEDVSAYSMFHVRMYSTQTSAANGVQFQFSNDGVNPTYYYSYRFATANQLQEYRLPLSYGTYFRVVYVNGGALLTSFMIDTQYEYLPSTPIIPLNTTIGTGEPAVPVRVLNTVTVSGSVSASVSGYVSTPSDVPISDFTRGWYGSFMAGVGFRSLNQYPSAKKIYQDGSVQPYQITSAGTYDITLNLQSFPYSAINHIDVSMIKKPDVGIIAVRFWYFSEEMGTYVQFNACASEYAEYGRLELHEDFSVPIVAYWEGHDARFGFFEVIDVNSANPTFTLDIIVDHTAFDAEKP